MYSTARLILRLMKMKLVGFVLLNNIIIGHGHYYFKENNIEINSTGSNVFVENIAELFWDILLPLFSFKISIGICVFGYLIILFGNNKIFRGDIRDGCARKGAQNF